MAQDWGTKDGRLIYSLAVAGVQFLLPLTVLALVHAREETSRGLALKSSVLVETRVQEPKFC